MNSNLAVGTRVDHPAFGEGIIAKVQLTFYEIFFEKKGKVQISKSNEDMEVLEEAENKGGGGSGFGLSEMEEIITHVLDKYGALSEIVPMGNKWEGGTVILQPGNPELSSKEIDITAFFHKIVMIRDRLRVLEQNINSHPVLSDGEKVDLQQYITRIYGSLTTFNVLFSDKEHYFVGQKGK